MKKWNSAYILYSDTTHLFNLSGTDSEGQTVNLLTDAAFRQIMLSRYNIFSFLSPGYLDMDTDEWVDLVTTKADAINYFKTLFDTWMNDKKEGYIKLYEALRASYNPVNNYDKTIHETTEYSGQEINTMTPTGSETNTLTKSGTEKNTETPTGSETNTLTKSGTETSTETPTGEETVTHSIGQATTTTSRPTFDSSTMLATEQAQDAAKENSDTTTFDDRQTEVSLSFTNRQDAEVKTFTNRKTENELSFTNRQDTEVKSFTDRQDEAVKSFDDRIDTHDYHEYGNIGVTTSQQMITSQFPLTELDKLQHYIVDDFVHNNMII